jgi:hypothetical protein
MICEPLKTPVAFFVFKRPETTLRVFSAISKVKPARMLLIADGPRQDREGEADACLRVREIVAKIDWPCEVSRNFSESNLGCGERIISGLNWVFSLVEEAIILEDDCLPDSSFFPFCQELLEKYRGDTRISYISGTNLVESYLNTKDSYYFSRMGGIWGWATWRSEWRRYDRYLSDWQKLKSERMLSEVFCQRKTVAYWTRIFDAMYDKRGPNTWDYQWLYTGLKNGSLAIVPRVNLIGNIGFGEGATHMSGVDSRLRPPVQSIEFPLKHPSNFIALSSVDQHFQNLYYLPLVRRVLRKLQRLARWLRLRVS